MSFFFKSNNYKHVEELTHGEYGITRFEPSQVEPNDLKELGPTLEPLYSRCNGGYLISKSLLIRPARTIGDVRGVMEWNQPELWKFCFEKIDLSNVVFFAENVIGEQFCVKKKKIYLFDPETGEFTLKAKNIEEWARLIFHQTKDNTLWPIAQRWEKENGEIPDGKRLVPYVPFIGGGEYEISNLFPAPDYERMRIGGQIATQIADLPAGTTEVELVIHNE